MAYVNYKNSPSEETPLTGGATGNLNVMQENGTSHGTDTKLGYAQSFLNEHIVNVSNEVDEDYRVNFLKNKNLLAPSNLRLGIYSISNGEYTSSTNAYCTKKRLEIDNTKNYVLSASSSNSGAYLYVFYYKADGTYLGYVNAPATTGYVVLNTYANYSQAKYVNFRFDALDMLNTAMFEEGSSKTTYEAYNRSIYVDGEEIYSKPVVLWQNANHNNTFASQTITLNDNISNYDYYEIIYEEYKGNNVCFSTGKIPTNMTTRMIESTVVNYRRSITAISGSSITFGDCGYNATYNSSTLTTENERIIPYQILGYK